MNNNRQFVLNDFPAPDAEIEATLGLEKGIIEKYRSKERKIPGFLVVKLLRLKDKLQTSTQPIQPEAQPIQPNLPPTQPNLPPTQPDLQPAQPNQESMQPDKEVNSNIKVPIIPDFF